MEKLRKFKPYIIYTFIFVIMTILVFFNFIKFGKSLIREGDGFYQHFVFMCNFSELLKNSIFNINNGIPMFSWEMGLGLDIIGQYSYYVIGDLFRYISIFFSQDNMVNVYNFTTVSRIYFSGIAFIIYSKYNNKNNFKAILGGVIYAFCGFNITYGTLHPYFINAAIIFPIMLLAIDKFIKEDKISFAIFIIFLTAIMNYYFYYKITILIGLYFIIKMFCENKEKGIKFFIIKTLKLILAYVIGTLMAAIVLFPTIYTFVNSDRFLSQRALYNSKYYENLFVGGKYFSTIFWVPVISILAIPIAISQFKDKEKRTYVIYFIIETIMLLVPFIGSAMNGFSFPINRWTFAYTFILVNLLIEGLSKKIIYSKKQINLMLIVALVYIFILINLKKVDVNIIKLSITFLVIILGFIMLRNLKYKNSIITNIFQKFSEIIIAIIICFNIICYANIYFGVKYNNNVSNFLDNDKVLETYANCNNQISNFKLGIEKIKSKDNNFYRINEVTKYSKNESLLFNYKSLNSYLSLGNGYIGKLSRDLINSKYEKVDALNGLDNRTKITTLLANKYYITSKEKSLYVPFGYELYKSIDNEKDSDNPTQIYTNKYELPIGVFYDNYTLEDDYNKLTALEKEQIILDTAVIKNKDDIENYNIKTEGNLIENIKNNTTRNMEYTIIDGEGLIKNNIIKTDKANQSIKLNIKRVQNSELYILFEGLEYSPYTLEELRDIELEQQYTKIQEEEFKTKYKSYNPSNAFKINIYYNDIETQIKEEDKNTSAYYIGIKDKLVNLGYSSEHSGNIKIVFDSIGKYKYKNIKVIAVPMDNYINSINKLKDNQFKLTKYNNNYIKGNIVASNNGILQFSIPFTEGWNAYVDGEKNDIINVNTAFIGIPLKAGKHEIYFKYETPYLKIGIITSIFGFIMFICVIVVNKVKKSSN